MNKQKSIEALQFFVTNLNAQSFQHKLQAKIFGSIGYKKLEAKYLEHAEEEIRDLAGTGQTVTLYAQWIIQLQEQAQEPVVVQVPEQES